MLKIFKINPQKCYNNLIMNLTNKWLLIGFLIFFVILVIFAALITLKFNLSSMDIYTFIDSYFGQWSEALVAFGTMLLALVTFLTIRESRFKEQLEKETERQQSIMALYDELHYNLGRLNGTISDDEIDSRIETSKGVVSWNSVKELKLSTETFDGLLSSGQLYLLGEIRIDVIMWYQFAKDYNRNAYDPIAVEYMIDDLHNNLEELIIELESQFKFLPKHWTMVVERTKAIKEKQKRSDKRKKSNNQPSLP
jgi:uncharacterized membrane protein